MIKLGKYTAVLLTCAFFSSSAWAFIPPDTDPVGAGQKPEANLSGTPSEAALLTSAIKEVMKTKQTLTGVTDVTRIKQLAKVYMPNLGNTAFNFKNKSEKKKQKIVTYSRTIENCKDLHVTDDSGHKKRVDISDSALVQKAFDKLFFQYPSKNNQTKYQYAQKGEQLKMDTTIEMFITAKEMQKELRGKEVELFGAPLDFPSGYDSDFESKISSTSLEDLSMITQLRLYQSCLLSNEYCDIVKVSSCEGSGDEGGDNDGSGSGENEDMVCFWNSAIKAEKLYDTIMIYNQFVVAMLAQYRSVIGISSLAKIREYQGENGDNQSALEPIYFNGNNTVISQKITADAMFADMSAEERAARQEIQKYQDILDDPSDDVGGDFELSDGAEGYVNVMDNREEAVLDMASLASAEEDLQRVETIHNVLQRLPNYEDIYKNFNYLEALHNTTRKVVAQSGACAMNMLQFYYEDPSRAMFGPNKCSLDMQNGAYTGKIVCHYDKAKAFSDISESEGLMDVPCPDDASQKCYIAKLDTYIEALGEEDMDEEDGSTENRELEKPDVVEVSKKGGILQYAMDLYRLAIDGNAIYDHDTETVLEITPNAEEGANYTAHVDIQPAEDNMTFDDKTRAAKYVNIYKPEENAEDETANTETVDPMEARRKEKVESLESDEDEEEDASSIYVTERDEVSEDEDATDDSNVKDLRDKLKDVRENPDDHEPKDPEVKDDETQDNMYADTQIEGILRWTIGKEIMSIIAVDLACGLNIAGGECFDEDKAIHFSKPNTRFTTWKDFEAFIDQYFEGKYANIKEYLNTMPDAVLLLNLSGLTEIPEVQEALDKYYEEEAEKIQGIVEEQDGRFKKIDDKYNEEKERLEEKKDELIEQKKRLTEDLSKANATYNQMAREISGAKKVQQVSEIAIEYNEKLYEESGRTGLNTDEMPQKKNNKILQEESKERLEKAAAKRDAKKKEAERYEKELEKVKEKIEKIDEDLYKLHRQYIKDLSDAEYLEMLDLKEGGKQALETRTAMNLENLTINGTEINFAEILPGAADFLSCMRNKLIEKMEQWEYKYEHNESGSCRRYNDSVKNYLKINTKPRPWCRSMLRAHRKLIDDLMEVSPAECGGLPEIAGLVAAAPGNALASICGSDGEKCKEAPVPLPFDHDIEAEDCERIQEPGTEGSDSYFVGLIGQPKDFMAPYPPGCGRGDDNVPMREAFFFSSDDFGAISLHYKRPEEDLNERRGVNEEMFFSRRLMLKELIGAPNAHINSTDNYIEGEDNAKTDILPRWWRWILLPRTYVQRPFDLTKLIGIQNGNLDEQAEAKRTQQEVRRSGLYPCRSLEYDYDGKPTGRTYHDKYGNSLGIPLQYFIDINSNLQYAIPPMTKEKYTREMPIEQRVGQHPEWINYSTTWVEEGVTSVKDIIYGVPECLSLQARVKDPETGDGLKVYDKEAGALMDNQNYDYAWPTTQDGKTSELGNIFAFYRESEDMQIGGFFSFDNPYYTIEVDQRDDAACIEKCHGNPICMSSAAECQPRVVNGPLRMTFNDTLVRALYADIEHYGEKDHEEETSRKDLTKRVFPQRNTLGDFLEQIEAMRIVQNDKLTVEKKVKTTILELAEILKDTGFEFGEDFNLACKYDEDEDEQDLDEEEDVECVADDYIALRDKLTKEKDEAISRALKKLSEVKAATTTEDGNERPIEVVAKQRNDAMRRILLYQMDTPEYAKEKLNIDDYPGNLVIISGDECTVDGDELDCSEMEDKMKEAYANWTVISETTKEQDRERALRLKQHIRPYCASYRVK